MKIKKIEVSNYRLLKEFNITLNNDLSLVIGKNNTGKTSLLSIMQKFLCSNSNTFNFEDFNIEYQKEIISAIESEEVAEDLYQEFRLALEIFIEYEKEDNLENLSKFILDLDPDNNTIILSFQYCLNFNGYKRLRQDYKDQKLGKDLIDFLKKHHKAYFSITKKVIDKIEENNAVDVEDFEIQKILQIKSISAKRDVVSEDGTNFRGAKTLSGLSSKYFKPYENTTDESIIELQKKMIDVDKSLTKTYESIFKKVVDSVKKFSYDDTELKVTSNLEETNLLKENTSVVYGEGGSSLPEDYNGLGYLNLFSMIFELHIILEQLKETSSNLGSSSINILFIEEPEAHAHPQMQYVFIRRIKEFLQEEKGVLNLQTIVTSHSPHVVCQSGFEDIKYFLTEQKQTIAKNLSDLKNQYDTDESTKAGFQFLKKYLTLERAELFFSDKVILVEGDTEKIILSAMMKKVDNEEHCDPSVLPLMSQKISIVEAGAYSHVFEKFLKFLGIKVLIITDIDSVGNDKKACPVSLGVETSNTSLRYFFPGKKIEELKKLGQQDKIFATTTAPIYVAYQTLENDYYARSFEDSFIALNLDFIKANMNKFESLVLKDKIIESKPDYYDISKNCINKKTNFITDVLFYSNEEFTNWKTPEYIKEGLIWLRNN